MNKQQSEPGSDDQFDRATKLHLTGKYSEIEARCRKAFLEEDGYGEPGAHPERYRVFRDGFYAAWMRALEDLGVHATKSGPPLVTQQQSEGNPISS